MLLSFLTSHGSLIHVLQRILILYYSDELESQSYASYSNAVPVKMFLTASPVP